ncbi:restriction endonuclease subunit S [Clostridium perfringens]|uniref:restriction endonuclease subunit S n=1 Tax=Clostridium perfringens TaxID=1502 RepID=UPI002AC44E01|nr:restriction endonuclease subunit S [Clostridium perfringens]MDZ5017874.1 restriction endonuclease subunit S [Clostridium perfringens]
MNNYKVGDLLSRVKDSIDIVDNKEYKRVTIKSKNQGICLRDIKSGSQIGTKKQFLIKSGQFLLSKIDARNGAFGIVPSELDSAIITGNFWTYEIKDELLNIEWFNLFVSSANFINICEKSSSGTTNRKYLDEKLFLDFNIELPSLEEQTKIVNVYKEKNEKYKNCLYEIDNQLFILSELKNQILKEAVEGNLIKSNVSNKSIRLDIEDMKREKERLIKAKVIKKEPSLPEIEEKDIYFEIPDSWEWVRLGDICSYIQRGKSPKYSDIEKFPVISQKCIQWSGFEIEKAKFIDPDTLSKYTEERFLKTGDLLWNSTGLGTLGRINMYDESYNPYEVAIADSHVTVIRPFSDYVNSKYILYWLSGPIVQSEIVSKSSGSTKQKELYATTIKEYLIPLPSLEEQNKIVCKVEKLLDNLKLLEMKTIDSKQRIENIMYKILEEEFSQ